MSGRIVGAVLDTRMPDHAMKCVMVPLAEAANEDGYCWPAVVTIAERIQYSKSTVLAALERLVEGGWVERRASPYSRNHNAYQIALDRLTWEKPKTLPVVLEARRQRRVERAAMSGCLPFEAPAVDRMPFEQVRSAVGQVQSSDDKVQSSRDKVQSTAPYKDEPSRTVMEPKRENARAPDGAQPPTELQTAVSLIALAHPRAVMRAWAPEDVPMPVRVAVVEAIRAEAERAGCSKGEAAEMIRGQVQRLAREVPREQWRYLKDVEVCMRLREYRMDAGDLTNAGDRTRNRETQHGASAGHRDGGRREPVRESAAAERERRSHDAIRSALERRAARRRAWSADGADEGAVPDAGDAGADGGDVPGGLGAAGGAVRFGLLSGGPGGGAVRLRPEAVFSRSA
jgi:hypothetical protein